MARSGSCGQLYVSQWANTNPPQAYSGYQNPGWPGCCRPPKPDEYKLIGAADWPAVSLIHHIPIPPDVKALLDSLTTRSNMTSPGGGSRATNVSATAPSMSRRTSYQVSSPTRADTAVARSAAMPISPRGRSSGSPQQAALALANGASRHATGNGDASSLPNRSTIDQYQGSRRSNAEHGERRSESTNSSQHSPGHRNVDLGGSMSRRNTERRASVSNVAAVSASKAAAETQPLRRRTQTQTTKSDSPPPVTSPAKNERERSTAALKRSTSTLEKSLKEMSISSASSTSSGSTSSETTIISEGGFTDYLSDESEAELQRQAEVKAALLAQSQVEELEFRVARQQLATVGLRPPKSWNGTNTATPRSQTSAARPPTYRQASDYNMSSGKTGVAQGRG